MALVNTEPSPSLEYALRPPNPHPHPHLRLRPQVQTRHQQHLEVELAELLIKIFCCTPTHYGSEQYYAATLEPGQPEYYSFFIILSP
ncbi:MAG: hypothetical protein WBP64_10620 [Nitrososphaeraceae archaeon]